MFKLLIFFFNIPKSLPLEKKVSNFLLLTACSTLPPPHFHCSNNEKKIKSLCLQ